MGISAPESLMFPFRFFMIEERANIFDGRYQISNLGKIISLRGKKEKNMKIRVRKRNPYPVITFHINGKIIVKQMHILMATAFIPNPENKPQVNHKNGIKTDYSLSNLEWVTVSENAIHAFATGLRKPKLGEEQAHSKLKTDQVISIFNSSLSPYRLSKIYKVSIISISDIKTGRCWSHITGKVFSKKYNQISKEDVMDIFKSPLKQHQLAAKYNVNQSAISEIKTGKTYSYITGKKYRRIPKEEDYL